MSKAPKSPRSSHAVARGFAGRAHDHAHCVDAALSAASAICDRAGLRLTPIRKRVLELVWSSHQPIGAYAILDRLRADGRRAAPPTVYRALEFLVARKLVHRVESQNAFVGCGRPGMSHPAQLMICRRCGAAAELDDAELSAAIGRTAKANGFTVEEPVVELLGICQGCADAKGGGRSALAP